MAQEWFLFYNGAIRRKGAIQMGISEKIKRMGLSKAYDYLDKDPDANIPRLLD